MSRKHIYRGKPTQDYDIISQIWKSYYKDGFIYGSLFEKDNKTYICVAIQCKLNCYVNNAYVSLIEVIPETIGQYTGLTDRNGKKIFEGDIVNWRFSPCVVKWDSINACYSLYQKGITKISGFNADTMKLFEVIGNIHDNPELLEAK